MMNGPYYEQALALADDDPDLLDCVHEILMKDGITDAAYAQAFARMFYTDRAEDERISCSTIEKIWKKGGQVLSDIKLFAALSQCCDLIRTYVLASWENCVLSAWASKKEVVKTEKDMDAMETLSHAKNIIAAAAPLMPNDVQDSKVDWSAEDAGDGPEDS